VTIVYTIQNNAAAAAVDFVFAFSSAPNGFSCPGISTTLAKSSTTTKECTYNVPTTGPPTSLSVTAVAAALGMSTITRTVSASLLDLQVALAAPLSYSSTSE
jgi:hypothetical protein